MARTTRSGVQWSPWEFDAPDIFQSTVDLAPYVAQALSSSDQRAEAARFREANGLHEQPDEWVDEPPVSSRPHTPVSRSPSPLSDLPPSPEPLMLPSSPEPPVPTQPGYKRRRAAEKKARRAQERVARARASVFGPAPQRRHYETRPQDPPYTAAAEATAIPSSSSGSWIGPGRQTVPSREGLPCLEVLLAEGFHLVRWDGRRTKLILDSLGRIVAVLLGRPEGEDWDDVMAELVRVFEGVRRRGLKRGVFKALNRRHRRGDFYVLQDGFTKGPGQKKPGNLAHSKAYRDLLETVFRSTAAGRIAGFQSSGLASFLPKLYQHQRATLRAIQDAQSELTRPFANSVFPTATFNLGPNVVMSEHLDFLNNPFGMCAVTSAGNFDHQNGGHIYMKQLKVACEFPSGSTILLLSGTCDHGNTPIQQGETRYSMTQYATGALFRWAAYGHQSADSLLSQPGGAARKAAIDGDPGARAAWAVGLLSKAAELDADRQAVFGERR
ncbi:hypothetical protein MSAN_01105500 [Mycena sanguinolenta]|uniref:Uncharacterized protein n=1 Tax=Mycena sanguinolenta TaxID=230812 RepID=A0A8H6YTN5_9AGAR|nr:hypothetical protein MSAN_01105500 [Mycena sanguinolenta]